MNFYLFLASVQNERHRKIHPNRSKVIIYDRKVDCHTDVQLLIACFVSTASCCLRVFLVCLLEVLHARKAELRRFP